MVLHQAAAVLPDGILHISGKQTGAGRSVGGAFDGIAAAGGKRKSAGGIDAGVPRMGVDDALEAAGCRAGDEVRIVGRAFSFEGAEEFPVEDDGDAILVEEDEALRAAVDEKG